MDERYDITEDIKLPFEEKKFDIALWLYDHQEGVVISVVIYMMIAIFFVFARITIDRQQNVNNDVVDVIEMEFDSEIFDDRAEEIAQREKEMADVKNAISNEQGAEGSIDMSETIDIIRASELQQERIASQRAEYERGLAEIEAMKIAAAERLTAQEAAAMAAQEASGDESVKVVGNVSVSYSIINPIRHAVHLIVPSYTCEGGGEVVVSITVDRTGAVTSAKVLSGGDICMQSAAIRSAKNSLFNVEHKAAINQPGKITYFFVPQ